MRIPLSWLRDFVDLPLSAEAIAYKLTFAGLEVEDLEYVGLAPETGPIDGLPPAGRGAGAKAKGLAWDPAKIVVAQVLEVMPHPNADRLTLLRLDDGTGRESIVLTGAPNLFDYTGTGPLPRPLKVAYAREGSILYDGHKPGQQLMTLKRAKIRGVESYSMVCSEKELGISDEHEGILFLDDAAPVGQPLAEYMGDVVFTIKINPNMARNANVLGIARELAALTGQPLRAPSYTFQAGGPPLAGRVSIDIRRPELNPRFVLALIEGVTIGPSPYAVQRRLRLAGLRPINNIVDATNYVMLELGQPLHAFDYDVLVARAGGRPPTIITRLPEPGETLSTLDGVERKLDDFTILVADTAGALSLGGVMGGAESEVTERTTNVLLEGAAWEFINIRRTLKSQGLSSEAGYRFSRGVHPAMAERGVARGIEAMRQWAGGAIAQGLVDAYPRPAETVQVSLPFAEVERLLGLSLPPDEIVHALQALEFGVELVNPAPPALGGQAHGPAGPTGAEPRAYLRVTVPDHRLDIGQGVVGQADLVEEIARIYGYDRIPETRLADTLPPQRANPEIELEELVRDVLVACGAGLQEVVSYSLTTPEYELRVLGASGAPPDDQPYVTLANPMVSDRVAMRHSLLASVLEVAARNSRLRDRLALFELGPVYLAGENDERLPDEQQRLVIVLTGPRAPAGWQPADTTPMDFFDLKGVVETLLAGLQLPPWAASFAAPEPGAGHPAYMPGRVAQLLLHPAKGQPGQPAGWLGELHPSVRAAYDLPGSPIVAADFDLSAILAHVDERARVAPVPAFPPVKEDLAVVVDEAVPAARVAAAIEAAAGSLLARLTLFDVYRGAQLGAGKKSLAYGLSYQAPDRTLTDAEVARVRAKIVRRLKDELQAELRA